MLANSSPIPKYINLNIEICKKKLSEKSNIEFILFKKKCMAFTGNNLGLQIDPTSNKLHEGQGWNNMRRYTARMVHQIVTCTQWH